MLFSSITFLYFFLPITLLLYYMVCGRFKNVVLCLASFFFYAWGEPKYCILLFLYGFLAYLSGWLMGLVSPKWRKYLLWGSIFLFAVGLFYFKYAIFVWENLNRIGIAGNPTITISLPIGISFYTFQVISYVVDVYRGKIQAEKSFSAFLTYLSMFPQLIAGPIVRYEEIKTDLDRRVITKADLSEGIRRFVTGLSKKVLLADELGQMVNTIAAQGIENPMVYWIKAIGCMLQIYFDFSGYSDMAIGMGRMLGFSFPENFQYPFLSKSIREFWKRWHMTLGRFLRDYLYIPLGGNRVSLKRWIGNTMLVWAVSGIWHGAGWNFVLWGLFFGICLVAERLLIGDWLSKRSLPIQHAYTLFLLTISFVVFSNPEMTDLLRDLQGMFAFGNLGNQWHAAGFAIRNYGMLLFIAILSSTPWYRKLFAKANVCAGVRKLSEAVWYLICFLLSVAYLLNHSFHPFLYFRF